MAVSFIFLKASVMHFRIKYYQSNSLITLSKWVLQDFKLNMFDIIISRLRDSSQYLTCCLLRVFCSHLLQSAISPKGEEISEGIFDIFSSSSKTKQTTVTQIFNWGWKIENSFRDFPPFTWNVIKTVNSTPHCTVG